MPAGIVVQALGLYPRGLLAGRSIVFFSIGLMRLANHDREGAMESFQKAVETNAIGSYDYELSRAYLERMNAEKNWP